MKRTYHFVSCSDGSLLGEEHTRGFLGAVVTGDVKCGESAVVLFVGDSSAVYQSGARGPLYVDTGQHYQRVHKFWDILQD